MGEAVLIKGNRPIDKIPVNGSNHLITSGAVYTAVINAAGTPEIYIGDGTPSGDQVLWVDTTKVSSSSSGLLIDETAFVVLQDSNVYVNVETGDDDSGNGSLDNPYKTINHAISTIPKNLNGNNVVIYIAGSNTSYNEVVNINGYFGGELILELSSGDHATISKVNVTNCGIVKFIIGTLTTSNLTVSNSNVYLDSTILQIQDASTGIELSAVSNLVGDEASKVNVVSCTTAVKAKELSRMYVTTITGGDATNVADGFIIDSGSSVSATTSSLQARTLYTVSSGGSISVNAQPTVADY